jgi:RimJ/RimL family protein N-acetyltransferase
VKKRNGSEAHGRINVVRKFTLPIEEVKEKKLLGNMSLFNCNWVDRSAVLEIGILNSENWGRGYGSEAIHLLLDFAFKSLNLNRVELEVLDFNKRAHRATGKLDSKRLEREDGKNLLTENNGTLS